jgi:hypothetical protein
MSEKKTKEIRLEDLKIGDVYWSNYYEQCIILAQIEEHGDCIFYLTLKDGLCIPRLDNISEAPSLLKELL